MKVETLPILLPDLTPTAPPDGYLLVQLRQTLSAGYALSEPDGSTPTTPTAPTGVGFAPVQHLPSSGGFGSRGLVSGATTSRLDEVRGFDSRNPYVAGQYGVTAVEDGYVEYELDGITYLTEIATGLTEYRFGYVDPVSAGLMSARQLVGRDDVVYHERRPAVSNIALERNDQPVLLDFYAVARATSLDQLPVSA